MCHESELGPLAGYGLVVDLGFVVTNLNIIEVNKDQGHLPALEACRDP